MSLQGNYTSNMTEATLHFYESQICIFFAINKDIINHADKHLLCLSNIYSSNLTERNMFILQQYSTATARGALPKVIFRGNT